MSMTNDSDWMTVLDNFLEDEEANDDQQCNQSPAPAHQPVSRTGENNGNFVRSDSNITTPAPASSGATRTTISALSPPVANPVENYSSYGENVYATRQSSKGVQSSRTSVAATAPAAAATTTAAGVTTTITTISGSGVRLNPDEDNTKEQQQQEDQQQQQHVTNTTTATAPAPSVAASTPAPGPVPTPAPAPVPTPTAKTSSSTTNSNISSDAKAQARSERKRCREKQRRSDVNSQFTALTNLLRKIEQEDLEDKDEEERSVFSAIRGSASPSNRVDLIARTIGVLERLHTLNGRRRKEVKDLKEELDLVRKVNEDMMGKQKDVLGSVAKPDKVMMMVPMMMSHDQLQGGAAVGSPGLMPGMGMTPGVPGVPGMPFPLNPASFVPSTQTGAPPPYFPTPATTNPAQTQPPPTPAAPPTVTPAHHQPQTPSTTPFPLLPMQTFWAQAATSAAVASSTSQSSIAPPGETSTSSSTSAATSPSPAPQTAAVVPSTTSTTTSTAASTTLPYHTTIQPPITQVEHQQHHTFPSTQPPPQHQPSTVIGLHQGQQLQSPAHLSSQNAAATAPAVAVPSSGRLEVVQQPQQGAEQSSPQQQQVDGGSSGAQQQQQPAPAPGSIAHCA